MPPACAGRTRRRQARRARGESPRLRRSWQLPTEDILEGGVELCRVTPRRQLERRRTDLIAALLVVQALVADRTPRRPARIERVATALLAAHRSRRRHLHEWSRADRTTCARIGASWPGRAPKAARTTRARSYFTCRSASGCKQGFSLAFVARGSHRAEELQ